MSSFGGDSRRPIGRVETVAWGLGERSQVEGGRGTEEVEVAVVGGEGVVGGGVFTGDDDGGGVDAVLQGVEAGGGLALDGAGSGGLLRVGAIGGDLSGACHDSDVARERRGFGSNGAKWLRNNG